MKISTLRGIGLAAIAAIALSGCAAFGGAASSGVLNGNSDEPMEKVKVTKSDYDPRTGKNPILYTQYLAVADVAERLQIQIDWQTSSNGEACASEGIPYLGAGAAGGATETFFAPPATLAVATVTGVTYGLGGCVNGIVTHSYDGDYGVGDTLEKTIRDIENDGKEYLTADGKASLFHDIHATASFVRSGNTSTSPAPDFAKHMPDFHGPSVGTSSN